MKFDIITQFGIALHSSLGDNPYNRELTEKEKEYREKNGNHFDELKELYKEAVQNPNIEQKIYETEVENLIDCNYICIFNN